MTYTADAYTLADGCGSGRRLSSTHVQGDEAPCIVSPVNVAGVDGAVHVG